MENFGIHWQLIFQAADGTQYTASVYEKNYSGSIVPLTGTSSPFVTDEDDTDDIFIPVRTQSGYLRVVQSGGNGLFRWREMIPDSDTDRPVRLTHEENGQIVLDWMGFIQPQNFGVQFREPYHSVEYPLQCPLTVLNGEDINYSQENIRNFAFLLKTIVDSIPEICRPSYFIFQGGDDAQKWLKKCIDWHNFSQDGKASFSMFDCLEEMCKFWGWTARIYGERLYFVCPEDTSEDTLLELDYTDLDGIAGGGYSVLGGGDAFQTCTLNGGYANDNSLDAQLRGPSKATIGVNPNTFGNIICDPLDGDFEYTADSHGWQSGISYGSQILAKTQPLLSIIRDDYTFLSTAFASFTRIKKYNGTDGYGDPINVLEIKTSYSGGLPLMSLQMKYAHSYSSGFFILSGTTYQGGEEYVDTYGPSYGGNRVLFCKMYVVGNNTTRYWNGYGWQTSETEFELAVGNRKPRFFTRYLESSTSTIYNSVIETPSSLYGILHLDILGSKGQSGFPETDGQRSMNLRDFKLEFIKNNTVAVVGYPNDGWKEVTDRRLPKKYSYNSSNANRTREEYTEETIFCTENVMLPGYGVLLNADGSYLESVDYGSDSERPEQHKANRIAGYWAASKRKVIVNMRADAYTGTLQYGSISPGFKIYIDGVTHYPASISRDWEKNIVKLVNIEI